MTDELTPEERDALRQLPRERMPSAALEGRVVGAMRERGILAPKQRGKVVQLTTGRVAGLLAACIVLVIGAYSIGLHRGPSDDVLRRVEPDAPATTMVQNEEVAPALERSLPAAPTPTEDAATVQPEVARKLRAPARTPAPATAAQTELQEMANEKKELEWSLKDADQAAGKPDEGSVETVQEAAREELAAQSTDELRARGGAANEPVPPATQSFSAAPTRESGAPTQQHSFQLGGASLTVDAPESIEVTEDAASTTLVINSSGSLVRIRRADVVTPLNSSPKAQLNSIPKAQYKPLGTVTRSYQLGASRFEVQAPAGFRVVEDRKGGMLLIYTSDGIVRIRLAD